MLLFPAMTLPFATLTFAGSVCNNHAPMRAARFARIRDARATAPPPCTMEREPQVEVE
jgi:hypothetical protein